MIPVTFEIETAVFLASKRPTVCCFLSHKELMENGFVRAKKKLGSSHENFSQEFSLSCERIRQILSLSSRTIHPRISWMNLWQIRKTIDFIILPYCSPSCSRLAASCAAHLAVWSRTCCKRRLPTRRSMSPSPPVIPQQTKHGLSEKTTLMKTIGDIGCTTLQDFASPLTG